MKDTHGLLHSTMYSVLAISVKNAIFIQTAKHRIAQPYVPVRSPKTFIEHCERSSNKMNGKVTQLTARQSWEEDDAVQKMEEIYRILRQLEG